MKANSNLFFGGVKKGQHWECCQCQYVNKDGQYYCDGCGHEHCDSKCITWDAS